MRFPSISHIFHRRVKSDSALAELSAGPMTAATLALRPGSANGLDELVLAAANQTNVFAPYISAVPVSITHPLPSSTLVTSGAVHGPLHPYPASSALQELKQRIRELEAALEHQYKANRRIPALEGALQNERIALRTAQQETDKINAEKATLRANLINTQRSLHTALTHPGADDRARVLAAENAALTAERLRHRKFIELMIAAGAHKPVLDQAYRAMLSGTDPEAALVAAIREAISKPGSAWAALLEPVMGPRSPAEYAAQVRCTLGARKDAKEWRKRAKFWKGKAREQGAHAETVTPSPSDVSSVVEVLSDVRQRAVSELMEKRRSRALSIKAGTGSELSIRHSDEQPQADSLNFAEGSLPSVLASLASSLALNEMCQDSSSASSSSSVVLNLSSSSVSAAYANLAPLASEIFRASHSISGSQRSSLSSLSASLSRSLSRSLSLHGYVPGFGRTGISASASRSSQESDASARSKRRRVEVVSVAQARYTAPDGDDRPSEPAMEDLSSVVSSLAALIYTDEATSAEAPVTPPASSSSAGCPSAAGSSTSDISHSVSPTPKRTRPAEKETLLTQSTDSAESSDDLVIIMHSDANGVSRNTPKCRSVLGSHHSPTSRSRTPSPEKSRLPVLKKAIRRLSISRPVLVDTTNAATFTFSTAGAKSNVTSGTKKSAAKSMSFAKTQGVKENGPINAQEKPAVASPPRPSKIPMGRRIQQMPADIVGSARRAVQTKTRMRTGTA